MTIFTSLEKTAFNRARSFLRWGRPLVITFVGEEDEVKESLGIDDVRIFATVGQQIKDVVGVMRQMAGNKESMKVGVQMWFSTPAFLLNLFQRANPKVQVADIAPVMDELRMVKDESEIELMRKAARIAMVGMDTASKWLKPGITENEVGAEIEYAMRKAGGDGVATPVFVNSGFRSGCANLARTFVVGPPTPKQRAMFDTYRRAQAAGIEAIKPGAPNRAIDAAARAVFSEAGYEDFYVSGFSHSIGLDFEEMPRPTIHPADSRIPLRDGMTLTVDTPCCRYRASAGFALKTHST